MTGTYVLKNCHSEFGSESLSAISGSITRFCKGTKSLFKGNRLQDFLLVFVKKEVSFLATLSL